MATLSEMIILWWLFIALKVFICFYRAQNIMMTQKWKGYQGTGATDEAFEYENTRSEFKCCNYREKLETIRQTTAISITGTQGAFSVDKIAPDFDDFTDELT